MIDIIARQLNINPKFVEEAVALLDEGATIPFISRYRKERTGGLDEISIRNIETALALQRELAQRRTFIIDALREQGVLTGELEQRINKAQSKKDLEDIYAPYKPKRRTRATAAREKGLEPLAKIIMAGKCSDCSSTAHRFINDKVASAEDALNGASDIIAEWASESIRLRNIVRRAYQHNSSLKSVAVKGKEDELKDTPFERFADFSCRVKRMSSHQYLAMRRAESKELIKVKYVLDDPKGIESDLIRAFTPAAVSSSCSSIIENAVSDSFKRLLSPSVENEISALLKEDADRVAIDIFADNLSQLLLAAPLKGKRVLALDPGYRTGCKVVALDEQGNLLEDTVIYAAPPRNDTEGAARTLCALIQRHKLNAIALGNGTASRETETFLKKSGIIDSSLIFIVNEDGASVYSASDLAHKEFPDKDVTVRGAVSIGRRLIDPLAELVKIDPKSIGVGQYQHDVDHAKLKDALDFTVMSCVNRVGVDLNTASEQLLSYVSGIGPTLAANIVAFRRKEGDFTSRYRLRKVPRLGDKAFEQSVGFLRIINGDNPLDNTGIHPESYHIVEKIAGRLDVSVPDLMANKTLLDSLDSAKLASEGLGGAETIADIIAELKKPGRDPRLDTNVNDFKPSIDSFEQLRTGMIVRGTIVNITAFGAFVNLGIKENGLIHISKMSRRRISSVSDVLKLGDIVEVKVIDINPESHKIGLSLLLD